MPSTVDEEELVREVLEDNPAEDRGERDEWAAHEGWHRKEDIRGPKHVRGANSPIIQKKTPESLPISTLNKNVVGMVTIFVCLLIIAAVTSRRSRGRRSGKPRSL